MSSVYTLDPSTVKFDDKYVVFNPTHNEMQYEATRQNIKLLGQLTPILMLDGKCVDGRHRVRVAKELETMVLCEDLDASMREEDIVVRCNTNVMSGRDYDNAQKAIQALRLVNEYTLTAVAAAKLMKVDKRLVSYASTIKGLNRQDLLDILMEGNKVQLKNMERPSKSLEVICKYVKAESEEFDVVVDDSERVKYDPDAIIRTEAGKAWFYSRMKLHDVPDNMYGVRQDYMEMANLKFRIKESK